MRIARYLARCGVAARRKAEEIILAGRVTVNGEVVKNLATRIGSEDRVELDGKQLALSATQLTLVMNKPIDVVVTKSDPQGRRTVYDLLPARFRERAGELVYVGRLDANSTGLLVLTTDGDLANRLAHPRHHVEKVYEAETDRALRREELDRLRAGIELDDGPTQPCGVRTIKRERGAHHYEVALREGRKRQVRRMFEAVGAHVVELERVAFGGLKLANLNLDPGEVRELTDLPESWS